LKGLVNRVKGILSRERMSIMSIQPEGEDLRKAVKWISDMRQDDPEAKLGKLIEQACLKFDLSPMDADYLQKFFREKIDDGV
jgi:hypothetical protein